MDQATAINQDADLPFAVTGRLAALLRSRPARTLAVLAGLAVTAAACSSSSSGLPTPGTGSPQAAASGFVQGLTSTTPQSSCTYVIADQQAACKEAFTGAPVKVTSLSVGNAFTDGTQALVTIKASPVCLGLGPQAIAAGAPSTTTCVTNTNASQGLPASNAGFAAAFAASFKSQASLLVACVEVGSQWFVVLNPPAGATGASGATSTTTAASGASGATTTTAAASGSSGTTTGVTGTSGTTAPSGTTGVGTGTTVPTGSSGSGASGGNTGSNT